ncbi:DUF2804 domain-containing protein [Endozoicomonas sp. Mp262]|uniref:DUF2804 domain-containing protein n=1 Tax=Endozoicomonas sp. Mp262 TaxID=2919499 RepID=UPI0021D94992
MNKYSRAILPTPDSAVTNGQCNFGTFDSAIVNLNLLDAKKPLGLSLPTGIQGFRLKEWEAIQIACKDWFFCVSVYNTKTIGTAIIMAYDRNKGRMYVYQHKVPCWKLKVPSGLANSHCYYHSPNFKIDINNQLDSKRVTISFSAKKFKHQPNLEASFTGHYQTQPIVIIQPFGDNRPLYSHKSLMSSEGTLNVDSHIYNYTSQDTCMIMDDHKGYYPYIMKYDWATAMGFNDRGELQGFNLTDNQVTDHEKYNENCLWLGGTMHPLPPIKIQRPEGVTGTWHIRDDYHMVRLSFTPLADVPNYLNLGFAETRYHGPTGEFKGFIMSPDKQQIDFDGFIGMGEKKYIRM